MEDENYFIYNENIEVCIETFCNGMPFSPLKTVTMEEAVTIFCDTFEYDTEEECYTVTDTTLKEYMDRLHGMNIDRTLFSMVEDGLIDYKHNGNDFVFDLTEKGRGLCQE